MLFTTVEPITPPQVVALVTAIRAIDALAEVRIDATGRQARIAGALTAQQAATALAVAGIPGIVTGTEHASGGSTCCGGCS